MGKCPLFVVWNIVQKHLRFYSGLDFDRAVVFVVAFICVCGVFFSVFHPATKETVGARTNTQLPQLASKQPPHSNLIHNRRLKQQQETHTKLSLYQIYYYYLLMPAEYVYERSEACVCLCVCLCGSVMLLYLTLDSQRYNRLIFRVMHLNLFLIRFSNSSMNYVFLLLFFVPMHMFAEMTKCKQSNIGSVTNK